MSIRDYLYSKAVTLCFLGIGAFAVGAFLAFADMNAKAIGTIGLLFLVLVLLWIAADYQIERRKIGRLERIIEELPEKYLLGEILPVPSGIIEQRYFEIMKTVSRAAVGIAEEAKREKEEYCDYVERWIHEIKTPLAACSLILANGGDPRKLKRELKQADNLTESILYYARMRTVQKDTRIQKIQVSDIVDEAIKSQMELLIAAGIGIDVQGDFTVHTDGKALCFILKQLLVNCAKYCRGCQVKIRMEDGKLTVEDNGIGIPSYEIRRVTERGFTGTNGRKLGGSTGMGLYLVKELCAQLGISLAIESEVEGFTRVALQFQT